MKVSQSKMECSRHYIRDTVCKLKVLTRYPKLKDALMEKQGLPYRKVYALDMYPNAGYKSYQVAYCAKHVHQSEEENNGSICTANWSRYTIDQHMYEVVIGDQPSRCFWDIDCKLDGEAMDQEQVVKDLLVYFADFLQLGNDDHIMDAHVTTASREDKMSFHVLFPNMVFGCVTQMRDWMRSFVHWLWKEGHERFFRKVIDR